MPMNGQQLRKARRALELTQVELSRKVHLHPNTIARMERGEIPIQEQLAMLVRFLLKEKRGR